MYFSFSLNLFILLWLGNKFLKFMLISTDNSFQYLCLVVDWHHERILSPIRFEPATYGSVVRHSITVPQLQLSQILTSNRKYFDLSMNLYSTFLCKMSICNFIDFSLKIIPEIQYTGIMTTSHLYNLDEKKSQISNI